MLSRKHVVVNEMTIFAFVCLHFAKLAYFYDIYFKEDMSDLLISYLLAIY